MKKLKLSKERKGIVVALLATAVIICSFAFLVKSPETTLATEIKLRTYETLNQNEPMTENDLQDVEHIKQWAMPIVEGTLKSQKRDLSDEEKQKVLDAVTATLQSTVAAGNIEINPDGSLTDLSKSYVSNAVANAIAYALPEIDLKSTVDGSTTQYTQILDMQKILNNLKSDNEDLDAAITSVNSLYTELSENSENNLQAVDTSLKDRMDALYTELEAEIVYNKKTGDKLTSDITDIQDTINSLLETQRVTSAQLKNALSDIKEIFSKLDDLEKKDSDFDKRVNSLSKEIDSVNSALVETQKTIEKSISDKVTELTQQQTEIRTELTQSITDTKNQLQNAIDSGITEINNKLYTNITNVKKDAENSGDKTSESINSLEKDLKNQINSTKQDLTTILNKNVTNITSNLTSTKSELQQQIDESYANAMSKLEATKREILTKQGADKQEILTKQERDKQELLTKQKEDREALEQKHQEDMDALNAKHDADKAALEKKFNEELIALGNKHDADKAAIEQKHQEDLEALNAKHDADVAKLAKKQKEDTDKLTEQQRKDREELENQQKVNKEEINNRVDTEVSNITNRQDSDKQEINNRIDTKVSEIESQQAADKKEMSDKIDTINANLQKQITDNLNNLTEKINTEITKANDKIDANDKETKKALSDMKTELTASIATVNNSLTTRINQEVATLNTTITALDKKLQTVNTELTNALNTEESNRSKEDAAIRADMKDKIQGVNDTILQLQQDYNLTLNDMLTKITNNGNDISSLSARLNAFISSADGHFKVDMVSGFTIKQSAWAVSGSNASYTFTHKYLKGCSVVEVDYASQYDLSPIYVVNDSTGSLTITIPAEQRADITVADIMCYHLFQDDQTSASTSTTQAGEVSMPADEDTEESSAPEATTSIDGHKENEESKDTYSQLDKED